MSLSYYGKEKNRPPCWLSKFTILLASGKSLSEAKMLLKFKKRNKCTLCIYMYIYIHVCIYMYIQILFRKDMQSQAKDPCFLVKP